MKTETAISRHQIRKILKSKRGAMSELARSLEVNRTTVSLVLRGNTVSERILTAATKMALDLDPNAV